LRNVISDGGSGLGFTKTGSGYLVLMGTGAFSGTANVNEGVLKITNSYATASAAAVVVSKVMQVAPSASEADLRNLVVSAGGNLTFLNQAGNSSYGAIAPTAAILGTLQINGGGSGSGGYNDVENTFAPIMGDGATIKFTSSSVGGNHLYGDVTLYGEGGGTKVINLEGGSKWVTDLAGNISQTNATFKATILNATGNIDSTDYWFNLSGSNSWTGGADLLGGQIAINNTNALGTVGTITISGSAIVRFKKAVPGIADRVDAANAGGAVYIDTTDFDAAAFAALVAKNDSLFVGGNYTYSGSGLTVAGSTYRLGGGSGTLLLQGDGMLTGTANVLVVGDSRFLTQTVSLAGSNSYGGGTIVTTGNTLKVDRDAALGLAPVSASTNVTLMGGATLAFSGGTVVATNRTIYMSGTGATISVSEDQTVAIGGLLTGTARLTKTGSGTLLLRGANDFAYGVSVNSGVLEVAADASLGTAPAAPATNVILNGGTLRFGAGFALNVNRTMSVSADSTLDTNGFDTSLSNFIIGSGGLTKTGAGTLTLGGTYALTGGLVAKAGAVVLAGTADLRASSGLTGAGAEIVLDGSQMTDTINLAPVKAMTFTSQSPLRVLGSGSAAVTQTITGTMYFNNAWLNPVTVETGTAFGTTLDLAGTKFVRGSGAVVLFRGTNLGSTPGAGVSTIRMYDNSPFLGAGGPVGTSTVSVHKYAMGDTTPTGSGMGLVVNDPTNGIRLLNLATETIDYAVASTGNNARITAGGSYTGTTVNSLIINNVTGSAMDVEIAGTWTPNAGIVAFYGSQPITLTGSDGVMALVDSGPTSLFVFNSAGAAMSRWTVAGTQGSGVHTITKAGPGSLTLGDNSNTGAYVNFVVNQGTLVAGCTDLLATGNYSKGHMLQVGDGGVFDMNGYRQYANGGATIYVAAGGIITNSGTNATIRPGDYSSGSGYSSKPSTVWGTFTDGTPEDGAESGLVSITLANQTCKWEINRGGQTLLDVIAFSNNTGNWIKMTSQTPTDDNTIYGKIDANTNKCLIEANTVADPTTSDIAQTFGTGLLRLVGGGYININVSGYGGLLSSSNTLVWTNNVLSASSSTASRINVSAADASTGATFQLGSLALSGSLIVNAANDFTVKFAGTTSLTGNATMLVPAGTVILAGELAGTTSFTKAGAGELHLGGTLAVGSLNVAAGKFSVAGPAIGGDVFVDSGAELALTHADGLLVGTGATLSGNGLISGTVNVQAGGIVAPGASIGTLTIQNLTLADALLNWELDAPGTGDLLICSTSLTASGVSTFQFTGSNWAMGYYTLINYGAFTGSIDNFAVAGTPGVPGTMWRLSETGSSIILQILSAENAWNKAAGGDWSNASNWTAEVPNSIGAPVILGSALAAPDTVNLDIAPTVGAIKFDNANKYTIGGTYTLTVATSSGNASIQVDTGSHEIAAPVTLGSDLAANIAGDLLTISGPMDGPYGVTKTGAGKLEINGTATYTGTTHVVNGELALGAAQTLGAVVIDSSALVTLVDGATQISSLEIAGGSSAPEAKLDIMSNALIIDYSGSESPLAEIEALIIKGYNGGDWAGNGITSSVLFDITAEAIGVIDNTTFLGGGLGEFAGRSIGMETVLVRKVIAGDIDMSGEVNAADYFYIDFNLDTAGGGWGAGDLDYSGETNSADYFYIDFNLGMSEGAPMGTSIPEPATLVLLTLGGLAVIRRKRK
jgi:autotransporter-associated beta strand protein